ncbi:hypothetical protein C0Q70_08992 [Pomacea canaliculata]|uniref:Uncharacterized protein n=1 Tax=Pomacea canaliculata TaxID=400727 RepID=A0A2T7P8K2_POMCA|nr:hypothetical protein C0Q70_08992 [Pomacea canaliculata]
MTSTCPQLHASEVVKTQLSFLPSGRECVRDRRVYNCTCTSNECLAALTRLLSWRGVVATQPPTWRTLAGGQTCASSGTGPPPTSTARASVWFGSTAGRPPVNRVTNCVFIR